MRVGAAALVVATAGLLASAVTPTSWGDPGYPSGPEKVYVTVTEPATFQSKPIRWWARHAVANRRALNERTRQRDHANLRLRHAKQTIRRQALLARRRYAPTVALAVAYARAVYGIDQGRRVHCESTDNVYASNGSHFGILQFAPSTWRTTPFARFSIYDPVAQALAGGWMVRAGRSSEWSCPL